MSEKQQEAQKEHRQAGKIAFTIREFQINKSDAQLLADCFNCWDDPESWPSGFSRTDPFTAQRILDDLETQEPITKLVAEVDGKIVGHCDVLEHFVEDDTVYVGLLGVNPEFQGKKIGKNLLLKAIEKAIEAKKDIITLHTWGSNLKAVPLYKKTGYFWAPKTAVYMESFLPGILQKKLFRQYFDSYDWYSTFSRELSLQADNEKIAEMKVYKYQFRADEQNALQVLVDRKAKKICGFELQTEEGIVAVNCLVDKHKAYAGYDSTTVSWNFKNTTNLPIQFTLQLENQGGLELEEEIPSQITVAANETTTLQSTVTLLESTRIPNSPDNAYDRVKPQLSTKVMFGEDEIDLTVGLIPFEPLVLELVPTRQSLLPGEEATVQVRVWNKTDHRIRGSIILTDTPRATFATNSYSIDLKPNQKQNLAVDIKVSNKIETENSIPLEFNIYKKEKKTSIRFPKQTIFIPVIDTVLGKKRSCIAYTAGSKLAFLENETLRLEFNHAAPYDCKHIIDKRDDKRYTISGALLDVGPPFKTWTSQLFRCEQNVTVRQEKTKASLVFQAKAQSFPGLEVTRIFTIQEGSDIIEVKLRLSNTANKPFKNIEAMFYQDEYEPFCDEGIGYYPLKEGLLRLTDTLNFGSANSYPKKAENWQESWNCFEFGDSKCFGTIWNPNRFKQIKTCLFGVPDLTFTLGELKPGQVEEEVLYLSYSRGSWKDHRKIWKQLIKKDSTPSSSVAVEQQAIISEVEVNTESNIFGKATTFGIQNVNSSDSLQFTLVNNTEKNLTGKLKVTFPKGITFKDNTNVFETEIANINRSNSFSTTFELSANEIYYGRIVRAMVSIELGYDTITKPLLLQILHKDSKVNVSQSKEEEKEVFDISNGKLSFRVCKDNKASLFELLAKGVNDENHVLSSWPETKPFLWFGNWAGGIQPAIYSLEDWNYLAHLETFTAETIESGPEKGVRFSSELSSLPDYEGLTFEIEYTTMPHSNTVRVKNRIKNTSDSDLTIRCGLEFYPAVSGKVTNDIYFKKNSKLIKRSFHGFFRCNIANDRWVIFTDEESKMSLAIIGPSNSKSHLTVQDQGELANAVSAIRLRTIQAKTTEESEFFVIIFPIHHNLLDYLKEGALSFF